MRLLPVGRGHLPIPGARISDEQVLPGCDSANGEAAARAFGGFGAGEESGQDTSGRIANPERIFFDLHSAQLTPEVTRANIHVDDGLLLAVRVAQNHNGVVRVVLDVNGVKNYAASLSGNPPQLLIDLFGDSSSAVPVRTGMGKHR